MAGTLGFLVASGFIAPMYTTFIFSFTVLTTAIPHAGLPFEYSRRAFGPTGRYLAGFATVIEFLFTARLLSARFVSSTETGLAGFATRPFDAVTGRVASSFSQPGAVLTKSTRVPACTAMSARTAAGMTIRPLLLTADVLMAGIPRLRLPAGKTIGR